MNLPDEKQAIRNLIRARRRELEPAWVRRNSAVIIERVRSLPEFAAARCVGCYMALPREVQTTALLVHCWDTGRQVCVPAFDTAQAAYGMALVERGAEMVPGASGIMEPRVARRVEPADIDFIVVPGLAFDRAGVRLGQGGGHYDRLLAAGRAFKVGIAFEFQIMDRVPRGEQDVPMNLLVTERDVLRCAVNRDETT